MTKNNNDLRYLKTKQKIFTALVELLEHESFERISVRMICQRAQVSRSGFYLHFEDKYALVEAYQADFIRHGMQIFEESLVDSQARLNDVFVKVLSYLNDQGKMLTLLLSKENPSDIQGQIRSQLIDNAIAKVFPRYGIQVGDGPQDKYVVAMITGAVISVLQEWIDGGRKEQPQELVHMIELQVLPVIKNAFFR